MIKLRDFLKKFDRVVIAFSGGVDSATLAALCRNYVDVLAVTVVSQITPSREIEDAKRVAREIEVNHEIVEVDMLTPEFTMNTPERCYICKKRMLSALLELAEKRGYDAVFEGTYASDLQEHRPGYRAVKEMEGVYSPWVELGVTKDEIRKIADEMGFSFSDKPSLACLATRIPYGEEINGEKLRMIDLAENAIIRIADVRQVRVRYYSGVGVIEVERNEIQRVAEKGDEIWEALRNIGFKAALLDLEGYRSGKVLF